MQIKIIFLLLFSMVFSIILRSRFFSKWLKIENCWILFTLELLSKT